MNKNTERLDENMDVEMPILPKKKILMSVGIIVVLLLLALFIVPSLNLFGGTGPLKAYFEPSATIPPDSSTNLVVEIFNNLNKDVDNATITVTAINPTAVIVEDSPQTVTNIGKGEMRRLRFPVTVSNTVEGTYSIEIVVKMDTKRIDQRLSIEVKQ